MSAILFCATGIDHMHGGIASANRNVRIALERLAAGTGATLQTLILHDRDDNGVTHRGYGGSKLAFASALLRRLAGARLIVFDHVGLALPLVGIPRALLPPIVIFAHGSESWRRARRASVRLFRRADLVLTNSHHTLARMRSHIPGFHGHACLLGLPPQFALADMPSPGRNPSGAMPAVDGKLRPIGPHMLLLVGRLDADEREKGHRELLDVLPSLAEDFTDVQVVFAGSGSDAGEVRRLALRRGLGDRVFVPGRVSDATLEGLYRTAFAYVMPSRQEGFGLVYLEAMNHALPCIACRDDGGAEVVQDGISGLLVPQPIDSRQLRSAIAALLANPARAAAMGRAGRQRLHEHFTSAMHVDRVAAAIGPLLA